MQHTISYNQAGNAGYALSTSVLTTGTDIITISDGGHTKKSQMTIYLKVDLTTATDCRFRILYSPDNGTTFIATPVINTATGVAADTPTIINTTSYNISGNFYGAVIDVPISGTMQFKINGKATGATAPVTLWVFTRDN